MRFTALLFFSATLLAACSRHPAPPDQSYTVRGVIESLPQKDGPDKSIGIHHEPVPGWINAGGNPVGMVEMSMHFVPARGVSLEGVTVGDTVEFVFEMRWRDPQPMQLAAIRKLPADTKLNFK